MNVYKITAFVVDHDNIGERQTREMIEDIRYPNHWIGPRVLDIETVDIGEWTDDHPLNSRRTMNDEIARLFLDPTKALLAENARLRQIIDEANANAPHALVDALDSLARTSNELANLRRDYDRICALLEYGDR